MISELTLTNMPDVVMNKILEKVDMKAILTLRKVCRDLRNFIDDVTPDVKLTEIEIQIRYKSIKVIYRSKTDRYQIKYEKHEKGTEIFHENFTKILENSQKFPEVFSNDFEIISKFISSKTVLKEFEICCRYAYLRKYQQTLKKIRKVLKLRPQKLKVRDFSIDAFDQDHILSVLPLLDPIPLYSIDIREPCVQDYSIFKNPMKINQLFALEQWKEAREFLIVRKVNKLEVGNFLSFSVVFLEIKEITKKVLEEIKEAFLHNKSSKLLEFDVEYDEFPDEVQFLEPFGVPYLEYDPNPIHKSWYFKMPHSPHFLNILQWFDGPANHVKFMIIKKCYVPKVVRDKNGW